MTDKVLATYQGQQEIAEAIRGLNLEALTQKAVWVDSVADMRELDAPQGITVATRGYYEPNDGGNGFYYIRAKEVGAVDDGGSVIFLDNDNEAKLITDGTVTPEQFGAKGDANYCYIPLDSSASELAKAGWYADALYTVRATDDTTAIQNAVDSSKSKTIIFKRNYNVSKVPDSQATEGYGHCVRLASGKSYIFNNGSLRMSSSNWRGYKVIDLTNKENVYIENPVVYADRLIHNGADGEYGHGIIVKNAKNVTIINAKVYNTWGDGLVLYNAENFYLDYIYLEKISRNGITIESGKNIEIGTVVAVDVDRTNPKAGIDIEMDYANLELDNVRIGSVYAKGSGMNQAVSVNSGSSRDSSGDTFVIDLTIGKIVADGCRAITMYGYTNPLYSGNVYIGEIYAHNITGQKYAGYITSTQYVSTIIERMLVENCNLTDQGVIYLSSASVNDENEQLTQQGYLQKLTINHLEIADDVVCKNSISVSGLVGHNNHVKLITKLPLRFVNSVNATDVIDWTGSVVEVHTSFLSANSLTEAQSYGTKYIHDLNDDYAMDIKGYWFIRNVKCSVISVGSGTLQFTSGNFFTIYPTAKAYTSTSIAVSAYGEEAEFMIPASNKLIIFKVPS